MVRRRLRTMRDYEVAAYLHGYYFGERPLMAERDETSTIWVLPQVGRKLIVFPFDR